MHVYSNISIEEKQNEINKRKVMNNHEVASEKSRNVTLKTVCV